MAIDRFLEIDDSDPRSPILRSSINATLNRHKLHAPSLGTRANRNDAAFAMRKLSETLSLKQKH